MHSEHRIVINIATRDRPTEVALLLESLRNQTFQNFDIYIHDDFSGTPVNSYHFLVCMINRLKLDGHKVRFERNAVNLGIPKMRQLMVDNTFKYFMQIG